MWTAFADLKHNTSPAINGDAFASAPQASSPHAPPTITVPAASVTVPHRHNSRPSRPSHTASNVSPVHSRRDSFRIDYGIWPFDDQDYVIVCTITNHVLHTNLSLWTPLLTEDARRQPCVQYSSRCCNCGSSDHSLRWCPAPFVNAFSLLNPEFVTHDTDDPKVTADVLRRVTGTITLAPTTEVLPRPLKVKVLGSRTYHTSPPPRLHLLRLRAPQTPPQPPRLHLPCVMARRSRATTTQTLANQVHSRYNLTLPHDGSKTVPCPYHCLRHYLKDATVQPPLTHR